MSTQKELNLNDMEKVTGGVLHTVNTGIAGVNAAFRAEATKNSKQIGSIQNGTVVDTVSDELYWDPVAKRHFVKVRYNGKEGYVASSILGLPR